MRKILAQERGHFDTILSLEIILFCCGFKICLDLYIYKNNN